MDAIGIVEEYFGDELTVETAERIAVAPSDHIVPLVEKLDAYYEQWFSEHTAPEQSHAEQGGDSYFYCVEPFPPEEDGRAIANRYKKYLLYFPRFAVPDPLADVFYPPLIVAHALSMFPYQAGRGTFLWDDRVQDDFRNAIRLLAEITPAVKQQDLRLVPNPYLLFDEQIQEAAKSELDGLRNGQYGESYYRSIEEAVLNQDTIAAYERHLAQLKAASIGRAARPAEYLASIKEVVARESKDTLRGAISWIVAEQIKLAGQICARFDYTAVAGDTATYAALTQDYMLADNVTLPAKKIHRIATDLIRYDIPGIGNTDLRTVLKIRQNEDAFNAFRRDFGSLIDRVNHEQPRDQREFEKEFRQAADDILRPRIVDVNKTLSVSAVEKFLVPAALSVGAGWVAHSFLGAPQFPVTAGAAALLGPVNWVSLKLNSRWNRGGRKAAALSDAYSMLLEKS
jgi:hypothetical protein